MAPALSRSLGASSVAALRPSPSRLCFVVLFAVVWFTAWLIEMCISWSLFRSSRYLLQISCRLAFALSLCCVSGIWPDAGAKRLDLFALMEQVKDFELFGGRDDSFSTFSFPLML
uniref:Uncharacterized protein n=1 Tax=Oryza brachyantha TaxID=4533 RepID=J3MSD6_ORYBR